MGAMEDPRRQLSGVYKACPACPRKEVILDWGGGGAAAQIKWRSSSGRGRRWREREIGFRDVKRQRGRFLCYTGWVRKPATQVTPGF